MKKTALLLILSIFVMMLAGCDKKGGGDNGNTVTVIYEVDGEGTIQGDREQTLEPGADATTVLAVAKDGWIFVGWDDGYLYPSRTDKGITESVTYVALFAEDGSGDYGDSFEDSPEDAPEAPEINPDDLPTEEE